MREKLLGSDDEVVAGALRLLWELDIFLADAATDRVGHLGSTDRSALIGAITALRDALTTARVVDASERDLLQFRRPRPVSL